MKKTKKIKEDAVVGGGACDGDSIAPAGAVSNSDILGPCHHDNSGGFLDKDCNHVPSYMGGGKPLSRYTMNGGKKKKKHPYEKGMKVMNEAEFTQKMILSIHKVSEEVIKRFLETHWNFSKLSIQRIVSIAYYPPTKTIFIKVECKDGKRLRMFYVNADFQKNKFVTRSAQIYNTSEIKAEYKKISNMYADYDHSATEKFSLWVIWGER